MSYIGRLDTELFYIINTGMQNRFFDTLMPWLTNRENWWPLIAAVAVYLLAMGGEKGRAAVIVIAVAVGLSDYTASNIIKSLAGRIRPCNALEGVHLLAGCTESYSFPSSHASNIFALAVIGRYYYRKTALPLFIIAITVGYSRVYVGVHYPFDVLGGFVWGGMVAIGAVWVEKRITRGVPG